MSAHRRSQGKGGGGGESTPPANRGVDSTSAARIDWLGYSLKAADGVWRLWEDGAWVTWVDAKVPGRYGWPHLSKWGVAERWWGKHDAPDHVDLSGQACRDVEQAAVAERGAHDWAEHLRWLLAAGARFSRLDLAVDVVGHGLTVAMVADAACAGRIVTRWKEANWREMKGIGPGVRPGHTLYFGSPHSDSMLRIYDKGAETGQPLDSPTWTRIELQCRREVAVAMAERIAVAGLKGGVEVMRGYLDVLAEDRTPLPEWAAAMHGLEGRELDVVRRGGTVDQTNAWLYSQVAPALAMMEELSGGDLGYLLDLVEDGRKRWNAKHKSIIASQGDSNEGKINGPAMA